MSSDVDRPISQPLVEAQLEQVDVYLKTVSREQLTQILLNACRGQSFALRESPEFQMGDEAVQAILGELKIPLRTPPDDEAISSPGTANRSSEAETADAEPVQRRPLLPLARTGLTFSVISGVLIVASPGIILAALIVANVATEGPPTLVFGCLFPFIAIGIPLAALKGTASSFKALVSLRKEGGRYTGYTHATWGLVIGAGILLFCLLLALLFVIQYSKR